MLRCCGSLPVYQGLSILAGKSTTGKEHLAGFWVPPQETLVQSTEMKQLLLPPFYAHPILLQWIPSEDVSFLPILQSQYGIKTV